MPSFRSILLLASTTLAGFTAAAPTGGPGNFNAGNLVGAVTEVSKNNILNNDLNNNDIHVLRRGGPGNFNAGNVVGAVTEVSKNNILNNDLNNNDVHVLGRRCGCNSVPDLFAHVQIEIDALTDKCHNTLNGGVFVDVNVAVGIVADVHAVILAAVADLQAIVALNLDINALLLSEGSLIEIHACADIVANVVIAVVTLLHIVLGACVNLDVTVLVGIVADIGLNLVALLKVVFSLFVGIDVIVCGLIKVVVQLCVDLNLQVVVKLLGLYINISL